MSRQLGFFDVEERLRRLSDLGDQLEAFAAAVDFELFRPALDGALACADARASPPAPAMAPSEGSPLCRVHSVRAGVSSGFREEGPMATDPDILRLERSSRSIRRLP